MTRLRPADPRTRKKWLFRMVAMLLSCALLLLGAEVTLRILGWGKPYYRFDPQIGYTIAPNRTFKLPVGEEGGSRMLRSNSLGLRDVEHAYEKPSGTWRVLVLGDSFCEAQQVDLEQTFFRVLQQRLDREIGDRRYEIINGGVSGFGTDRELLFYRHQGRRYAPDQVLLLFVFNDVRNNYRPMQLRMYGDRNEPYFVLGNNGLTLENFPARMGTWANLRRIVNDNLYLYYQVWKITRGRELSQRSVDADRGIPFDFHVFEASDDPEWDRAWATTRALIAELDREVRADGATLTIVGVTNDLQIHEDHRESLMETYPAMRDLAWDWPKPNRIVGAIAAELGIDFVDLLEPFRAATESDPTRKLHTLGGHWNADGHRLCADLLFEHLSGGALR